MNKRTDAREVAFKLIFEYLFVSQQNLQTQDLLVQEYQLTTEKDYVTKVYNGVVANFDLLNSLINKHAKGFSLERIYKVDKAILLVAMFEILYMPEVPYLVSINEALNLAKKYSTEKSTSFINGILSKISKDGNN